MPADLSDGAPSSPQSAGPRRLVVLAYILAISIPPFGLVLGVALILMSGRRNSTHGVAVLALSAVALVAWIVVLTSGTLDTTSTNY